MASSFALSRLYVWQRSKFWHAVSVLAGGTALAQACPILVSPILTRLYAPKDFGILALFTSTLTVVTSVAGLRLELSVVLAKTLRDAANLMAASLSAVTATTIVILAAAHFGVFNYVSSLRALQPYVIIFACGVWFVGAFSAADHWAVRGQYYPKLAAARIRQGIAAAVCQCLLFGVPPAGSGLLIGYATGQALGGLSLAKKTGATSRQTLGQVSLPGMARAVRTYWEYPIFVTPSALINTLGLQLPTILLFKYYGASVAGWYALGQRIIGLPLFFVGRAVSQAYLGEASRLMETSPAALYSLFLKTAKSLAVTGSASVVLIAALAPYLIRPVFGSAWIQAGIYLQLMAPAFIAMFFTSPLGQTLNIASRVKVGFALDCCRLMIAWASISLPYMYGAKPSLAILIFSLASMACYGMYFSAYLWVLRTAACRE